MFALDWNFSSTAEWVTGALLILVLLAGVAAVLA